MSSPIFIHHPRQPQTPLPVAIRLNAVVAKAQLPDNPAFISGLQPLFFKEDTLSFIFTQRGPRSLNFPARLLVALTGFIPLLAEGEAGRLHSPAQLLFSDLNGGGWSIIPEVIGGAEEVGRQARTLYPDAPLEEIRIADRKGLILVAL